MTADEFLTLLATATILTVTAVAMGALWVWLAGVMSEEEQ